MSKACFVGAVALFVNHHLLLAGAAVVGSFALSSWSGRASENGRIDEALTAKAEWDRLHPPEEESENLPSWKRPCAPDTDTETSPRPEDEDRPPSAPRRNR
ncbi:hypothetical protein [Kocuria tytonicola]|uniref:hypothetical protein n=1 Tax=Kocuria tytonicola TaxID=2055946 RepID=UPI000F51A133|nr:hypothetical protein [Kocuria tytonicola]